MTIHLLRMAARVESVAKLKQLQAERLVQSASENKSELYTYTRNIPKRMDELIDDGSIYWVIKKYIKVRQRILGIERHTNEEGRTYCAIQIDPELKQVVARRQKAFQGWRYLKLEDIPIDLHPPHSKVTNLPSSLTDELRELGLI